MSDIALGGLEDGADDEVGASDKKLLRTFRQEIKFYETKTSSWQRKAKKIVRRYKDERSLRENEKARFNILWSNVQLLLPALFAKNPVANIERRNRIKDDLGRVTSMVLERAVSFFIDDKFNDTARSCVLDLLLGGRGVPWIRYEPKFETASSEEGDQITDDVESEDYETVADEKICWDYVHLEDFGHSWGRVWDEVDMVWRMVPMDKEEMEERFPDIDVDKIPLNYSEIDSKDTKIDQIVKKAKIYELWNKKTNTAYWLNVEYEDGFLDVKDDPLGLHDFFPCPKPMFSTLANDSCIPAPDYVQYQDQAIELDTITGRIAAIIKAVKVAGVYDASAQGIQRLLGEGVENTLIPIEQWAMLSEKGGIAGVMSLLPMEEILQTLSGLYETREKVKQDIYEITGISDILRGSSDPNETYGAQRIKSQFGTLRLSSRQDDVQRFCRELIYIGSQIIAKHFSQETIKNISNMTLFTNEEKQIIQMNGQYKQQMQQYQQAVQQYKQQEQQPLQPGMMPQQPPIPPPQPPPIPPQLAKLDPEDIEELMDEPTWDEVMMFLQSDSIINYRIDIETNSTIKQDEEAEKLARLDFLKTAGGFMQQAAQVTDPLLAPLMAKMMMFGLRGFKIGRDLEGEFEMTIKKLEKEAQNPQKKPTPEEMKLQAQTQSDQAKLAAQSQLDDKRLAQDKELKMMQMQIDQQKAKADSDAEISRLHTQAQVDTNQAQLDAQLSQQKSQQDDVRELTIARMENETKIIVANINAQNQLQNTALSNALAPTSDGEQKPDSDALIQTVIEQLQKGFGGMTDAMSKPKVIVRDEQGNIAGVQ